MKQYVLGLMFNETLEEVLLIKKNRPAEQKGKLNGLGGKINHGEALYSAMVREFEEECGLETKPSDWSLIGDFQSFDYQVFVFKGKSSDILMAETKTDEHVNIYEVSSDTLANYDLVPALPWIIEMCLDDSIDYFSVTLKS